MTVNHHRLGDLVLVANGRGDGNHRRIDHDAVESAATDLLRAVGADVDSEALEETPVWDVNEPIRRLISEGVALDDRHLADPEVPIDALLAARRAG
jgi:hypothetical protein